MKILIEDYKRRLTNVEDMLAGFKNNGSINDIKKEERLKTKAAEYRTFIAEMERELVCDEELIKEVSSSTPQIFVLTVQRASFSTKEIEVVAKSVEEAEEAALNEALNLNFDKEDSAEYSIL